MLELYDRRSCDQEKTENTSAEVAILGIKLRHPNIFSGLKKICSNFQRNMRQ